MGTIKILGFDEDGNAQRLKIRIARFLDYDPVTASDKSNIRSTLGITSQGGLGDLLAANNLDDVASLDTTKANLEIPDVGTGPSQVPLNQYLGTMAYQDIAGVSIVNAKVETLEVTDKVTGTLDVEQSSGTLTTPASVTTLRVNNSGTASNNAAVTVTSGTSGSSFVLLGDNENDDIGYIKYSNQYNQLQFATAATDRVTIDASGNVTINNGNLVFGTSGKGIDFGSVAGGTGTPDTTTGGLLDDFETGSFSPTFGTTGTGFTTLTLSYTNARYTKIGNCVTFSVYLKTSEVDATGATGALTISGLPFTSRSDSGQYTGAVNVGFADLWANAPEGGYVVGTSITLTKRNSSITGSLSYAFPADLTSGVNSNYNEVMVSGHYYTA